MPYWPRVVCTSGARACSSVAYWGSAAASSLAWRDERAGSKVMPPTTTTAKQDVHHQDGHERLVMRVASMLTGLLEREGQDGRQHEQHQRVQDRADDLPQHPQHRHPGEQRQQEDEQPLPVAIQQSGVHHDDRCVVDRLRAGAPDS